MEYIGLILLTIVLGICGFGYKFFLFLVLAPIGAALVFLLIFLLRWIPELLRFKYLKKYNPKEYRRLQMMYSHSRYWLEKAEKATSEEERNEMLKKAELY